MYIVNAQSLVHGSLLRKDCVKREKREPGNVLVGSWQRKRGISRKGEVGNEN